MDVRDWGVGSLGKVLAALSTRTGVWNPGLAGAAAGRGRTETANPVKAEGLCLKN